MTDVMLWIIIDRSNDSGNGSRYKTNPSPRYTHQSTRITKPSPALFRRCEGSRKSILRKLGTPD